MRWRLIFSPSRLRCGGLRREHPGLMLKPGKSKCEVQDQQGMLFLSLKGNDHWMAQGFVICRTGLLSLSCTAGLLSPRWGVKPDTQTESISADKYSPNESAVLAQGGQVARCGCSTFAPVAGAAELRSFSTLLPSLARSRWGEGTMDQGPYCPPFLDEAAEIPLRSQTS